ncbi:MAG: SigE family RNA polymerase sigma factor [Actinomycetota bacterium]
MQLESAGSRDAPTHHDDFEDVFRAHHDHLVRLAGLLCGNATMAEDAVAEVFARLYRRWQPGMIEDVDAYLRRAVVNEIGGEFRRRTRRRGRPISPTLTTARSTEDAVTERDRMWKAMLRLPARQRAVLVLRYFDDASEARVAEILEMPTGTVKSTTARGLDGLRRILEGNDDGD